MIVNDDLKAEISAECDALFSAMERDCRLSRPNSQRARELADRAACLVMHDQTVRVVSGLERDHGLGRLCGMRPGDANTHHPLHEQEE